MEDQQWPLNYAETEKELITVVDEYDKAYLADVVRFWFRSYQPLDEPPMPVLLALALYGEVRGGPEEGRRAVFEVIANRANTQHDGCLDDVLLEPYQFSCFNKADMSLQRANLVDAETIKEWLTIASDYVTQWNADAWVSLVPGATNYCTLSAAVTQFTKYLQGEAKGWNFDRLQRVAMIGGHVFFREG